MRALFPLAAVLLLLAGCSSEPPPAQTAPMEGEGERGLPWEFKASRDVPLDGLEGDACMAVMFEVPEGTTLLDVSASSPSVSGSFPVPGGAGYVKARLFAPDGREVPMVGQQPDTFQPPVVAGYDASVEAPQAGTWRVEVEPNQATVTHTARVLWAEQGTSPNGEPPSTSATDEPC